MIGTGYGSIQVVGSTKLEGMTRYREVEGAALIACYGGSTAGQGVNTLTSSIRSVPDD